jgi:hypothetical protein
MPPRKSKKPRLFEVLFSSVSDPGGSMEQLLVKSPHPFHAILTTVVFLSVCIAAPLALGSYRGDYFDGELIGGVTVTTLLTLFFVSIFTALSVHAIGIRRAHMRTVAALAYSLAPMTLIIAVLAAISWALQGSCTILTFVAHGASLHDDLTTTIFPHVFRGSLALTFITLTFGLRTVTRGSLGMGAAMAALSFVLLLGSFVIGLTITELVLPQSSSRTIEFFWRYFAYPR